MTLPKHVTSIRQRVVVMRVFCLVRREARTQRAMNVKRWLRPWRTGAAAPRGIMDRGFLRKELEIQKAGGRPWGGASR